MLSEAVSTERAVSSLKEVYQQACSQVESEVAEPEKHQLQLLGHRLCDSVDDAKISRIRRLYAEFSADPRNAGLQGGCGEMWTFRDGGDLDISFPMQLAPRTHESQVKLRDRGENGEFQLAIEPNGNESELWYLRATWKRLRIQKYFLAIVFNIMLCCVHAAVEYFLWRHFADWKRGVSAALVIAASVYVNAHDNCLTRRVATLLTRIRNKMSFTSANMLTQTVPSTRHGPADTDEFVAINLKEKVRIRGVDIVTFVPAPPDVEQLLVEWRCRHQRRFVNSQHFDRLVPACGDLGMVMFDTMHQLWRLSLTEFECQWIRNLPKEQGLVLSVAKLLAKDSQLTDGHPVTSYPIKMSFFWFVYFSADSDWTPQRVCLNALKVLRFLEICFEKKSLPNYFYLDENVLWKYKKDATILVKIPKTSISLTSLIDRNDVSVGNVIGNIAGMEVLLAKFCSGKLSAWNYLPATSFLSARLLSAETAEWNRAAWAASVVHIALISVAELLYIIWRIASTSRDPSISYMYAMFLKSSATPFLPLFARFFCTEVPNVLLSSVEKLKSLYDSQHRSTPLVDCVSEIFQEVRSDVREIISEHEHSIEELSNTFNELGIERGDCVQDVNNCASADIAFDWPKASVGDFSNNSFRVSIDIASRKTLTEHLMLLWGAFYDALIAACLMTSVLLICRAIDSQLINDDLNVVVIAVTFVTPAVVLNGNIYRLAGIRAATLRTVCTTLSKLPIRLPTRVARLAHCLLAGEARLRVRTGQPDETLVLLDARRLTWRLCTDLRERRALACMSGGHKLSYSAVLSLARRLGVTRSNFEPLRVAFHWTASLMPDPQHWTVQNSLRNALLVLELCRRCHRRASLPNFFHPAENVALVRPETFNGVPKCHVILAHLLQADSSAAHRAELVSRLRCELEAVAEEEEVANAAAWGVGMLAARVIMLAGDLAFHAVFATAIFACVTPLIHMINAPRS